MPQYAQSSQSPFSGSPTGGNRAYWESVQGIAPAPIGGRVVAPGQGYGPPTTTEMAQSSAGAGRWASQNPVLAPQPPPLPMPQLPQAMPLEQMIAMMPGYDPLGSYGAGAWQLPGYAGGGAPAPGGAAAGGAPAPGAPPPGPPQISTGITQPEFGGPAGAPPMPTAPQWAGGDAGAGAYAQAIQPLVAQQAEQYYQQAGPLGLGAQQAQSEAGLNWATLWQLMNQQQGLNQQQQFRDISGALGRFA